MAKSPMGEERFFDALEALTYSEMLSVAGLLALQLGELSEAPDEQTVAQALSNSAESWREGAA